MKEGKAKLLLKRKVVEANLNLGLTLQRMVCQVYKNCYRNTMQLEQTVY